MIPETSTPRIPPFHPNPCGTWCGGPKETRPPQARSRSLSRVLHVALLVSFLLVILTLIVAPVAAEVLVTTTEVSTSSHNLGSSYLKHAQSMKAAGTGISRIALNMKRCPTTGNYTLVVNVRVRSSLNGADLATATIYPSQIPSESPVWAEVTMNTGTILTEGQTFYVVMDSLSGGTRYYFANYNLVSPSGPYADGVAYRGGTLEQADRDFLAKVWFTGEGSSNPTPTLTSISPSSATAGGSAFTLTATGTNFISGSIVRWNGADRTTTYVSATQLTAAITAADIATAGTASVTVFNPTPGGGTSGGQTFTINNPAPTLSTLSPSSKTAGSSAFTLTVTGTNFVSGSKVRWNGVDRTTTYVSATQLTASITAADIATAGTASVTVFNPTPGGGTSGSQSFTINNPAPTLSTLSPSSASAGGSAFTLTVTGTNFVSGSKVRWNGVDRTTTYVSASQLTASITAADIATAGTASVTVFNPTPGGGTSGGQTFTINVASNPVPTLSSISPISATAGGSAFTLTVSGSNFVAGSTVRWNGVDRTTSYVSATQLTASITAADIATAGTALVTVFTSTPGGGTSGSQSFTINNPAPTLTALSPGTTAAGSSAFTLTVTGSNFVAGSIVRWNGNDRTTTFVSATQLTASITAADVATAGTATVTVFNPTPGGGTSSGQTFTISVSNPVPTLSALSPSSATAGGSAFTLTVTGTNFVAGSIVRWNGNDRTTTYVSATQLTAAITAADIASSGTASVTVFNPTPGGGTSGSQTFTITSVVTGGQADVVTTESYTTTNYLGYQGWTYTMQGQSVKAAGTGVDDIAVPLARKTKPLCTPETITARLRASLNGPDLATATITPDMVTSTTNGAAPVEMSWVTVSFDRDGIIGVNEPLFVLLTTPSWNNDCYYYIYTNTNVYPDGSHWRGTSIQGTYQEQPLKDMPLKVWFTGPPGAAFGGTPTSGTPPLTVQFSDASTKSPTSWKWEYRTATVDWTEFGSGAQNPSFAFAAGTYDIQLTVTNSHGSSTLTKTGYIIAETPVPTPTPVSICNPSYCVNASANVFTARRGDLVNITVQLSTRGSGVGTDSVVLIDQGGDSMYQCMERDASYNCLGTRWDYAKEGAMLMLNDLNTQGSKYALFNFTSRGHEMKSWTSSPEPMGNLLEGMSYEPWSPTLTPWSGPDTLGYPGTSNLRDGLYETITAIKNLPPSDQGNPKALVVFTDGEFNYYGNPLAWGRGYAYTTKVQNWVWENGVCDSGFGTFRLDASEPLHEGMWEYWVDRMVWPRTSSRNLFPIWDYQMYDDLQGNEYKNFTGYHFVCGNTASFKIDPTAIWYPQSATQWPTNPMGHIHPNIEQYTSTDYQVEVCDPSWPYIDASGEEHGTCTLTEQNMSVYATNNGVKIYVVAISTQADLNTGLPSGINTSDDIMKILALSTGGKYYPVRNHAALLAAIADINGRVTNAKTEEMAMNITDMEVEVSDVIESNGDNSVFGHVHIEGNSTTIHSWNDGGDLVPKYTLPEGSAWNGGHAMKFTIGDVATGTTWETVYTVVPQTKGTISVFGNISNVTYKGGSGPLPEVTFLVENTPPAFDLEDQTVDLGETISFTAAATDADGDNPLHYSASTYCGTVSCSDTDNHGCDFSWTPVNVNPCPVTFTADDSFPNGVASRTVTIYVNNIPAQTARIRIL